MRRQDQWLQVPALRWDARSQDTPGGPGKRWQKKKRQMRVQLCSQLMELYSDVMTRSCLVLVAFKWARPNFSRHPVLLTHDALPLSSDFQDYS